MKAISEHHKEQIKINLTTILGKYNRRAIVVFADERRKSMELLGQSNTVSVDSQVVRTETRSGDATGMLEIYLSDKVEQWADVLSEAVDQLEAEDEAMAHDLKHPDFAKRMAFYYNYKRQE